MVNLPTHNIPGLCVITGFAHRARYIYISCTHITIIHVWVHHVQELDFHHWTRYQGARVLGCILLYQSACKTMATSGYRHQWGGRAAVEYHRPPAPHHLGKLNQHLR